MRQNEKPWSKEEIDFIIENYKMINFALIAKHLGRSINSIRGKINHIKLQKKMLEDKIKQDIEKGVNSYKIWQINSNNLEYVMADNSLEAIDKFLKLKKINKKIQYCDLSKANLCCQGNDNKRTKKYYKFI